MDDYAQYYYQRIGNDLGDFGDVSDRLKLRENLGCKSFKWFLTEIYPELFIPGEALAHGEIRNMGLGGNICLDSPATKKQTNKPVGLYPCHGQGGNQYWSYSKQGEIRRDELCVDYAGSEPMIYPCHGSLGNQQWIYDDEKGTVRHGPSRKCLAIASKDKLSMEPCEEGKLTQRWKFANYNPDIE
jgi:polypeptide N-acetylgalactosaminyltransferase